MNKYAAKERVRREWRTLIREISKPARKRVNGEISWICPICGHGKGGDGLTLNPRSRDSSSLKCFGCGFSGDIIALYMKVKGIQHYSAALKELAEQIGIRVDVDYDNGASAAAYETGNASVEANRSISIPMGKARVLSREERIGKPHFSQPDRQENLISCGDGTIAAYAPPARNASVEAVEGPRSASTPLGRVRVHPEAKLPGEPRFSQQNAEDAPDYEAYYKICQRHLLEDPAAIAYLSRRGISLETAQYCGVGSDLTSDPANAPGGVGEVLHPCHRLIFPSAASSYIGRSIDPGTEPRYAKMNPRGSTAAVFGAGGRDLDFLHMDGICEVFIVEGFMDAMSILEAGEMEVPAIALNSTSNCGLLVRMLEKHPTEATLILCLDNDQAGQNAAQDLETDLRRLNISCVNASADVCLGYKDPNEALIANRTAFIEAVRKVLQKTAQPDDFCAYIHDSMDEDAEKLANQEVRTGYPNLDEKTGGLRAGLYILAAISSLGKTTFVQQMADQIAVSGTHVLFFSLEQSRLELASKAVARRTAQNHMESAVTSAAVQRIRSKRPLYVQEAIKQYAASIKNRLSVIEGNFHCDAAYIGSYVRQYIRRNGVRPVVIIDYLQILQPDPQERGRQSIRESIDTVVTALKHLSRECGITVIAISSVNRGNYLLPIDFESLKESGGIEYSADVIWGLQLRCLNADPIFEKPNNVKEKRRIIREAKASNPRKIELVCLKNRYGVSSFSCFFDYYPANDLFKPAAESEEDGQDISGKRAGRVL